MYHTIVALSTPAAVGAIAVVRLSGDRAIDIADKVFKSASGKSLAQLSGYRAAYGGFYDKDEQIDEGIALVLRAPKSYTGEDMAELYCHGSVIIAKRIISACIAAGAVYASQGEFTRRAFENGKLDLSQAEAVAELISAEGEGARRAALARRNGAVTRVTEEVCDSLAFLAAELSVWSDYPEETDAPVLTEDELIEAFSDASKKLKKLADSHRTGKFLQDGVTAAIVGRPNVGKSTLLNRLTGEEKAIVTDIAGTTRDVLEARAQIGALTLKFLDTAGIRSTDDTVEMIGVERAKKAMESADIVLLVLDSSQPLSDEDNELLKEVKNRPHIIIENKSDIACREPVMSGDPVAISAKNGEGTEALSKRIEEVLGLTLNQNDGLIASERQYGCVLRAIKALEEAEAAVRAKITFDAAGILLDDALDALGELSGRSASVLTLEQVFSKFCVGK